MTVRVTALRRASVVGAGAPVPAKRWGLVAQRAAALPTPINTGLIAGNALRAFF